MEKLIYKYQFFECERLKIEKNIITYKSTGSTIKLGKKQRNLLLCLVDKIHAKKEIIRYLWGDRVLHHENKYNQLVFKLRVRLSEGGVPDDTILTIHGHGICLNKNLLMAESIAYTSYIDNSIF